MKNTTFTQKYYSYRSLSRELFVKNQSQKYTDMYVDCVYLLLL